MNFYRLQISASALLALIATSSVSAAQMGATSRDSVSISVTVPPHIVVTPAARPLNASSTDPTLCVGTNGFSQYHLALLRHSGQGDEQVLRAGDGQSDLSACRGESGVLPQAVEVTQGSSPGLVTLLVIPD